MAENPKKSRFGPFDDEADDGAGAASTRTAPTGNRRLLQEGVFGQSQAKSLPKALIDGVARILGAPPAPTPNLDGPAPPSYRPVGDIGAAQAIIPPPTPIPEPTPVNKGPLFGPGVPMNAVAVNPADVAGREFGYQAGYNYTATPRSTEQVSFEQLRALAKNFDLVGIMIETRKSQMAKVTGSFLPKKKAGDDVRGAADARCQALETFMLYPDRRLPMVTWRQKLLDDLFVIDAPSIYIRRTLLGEIGALEIVDGSTIIPRLDVTGRYAEPPNAAFSQYIHGMQVINYRADELIYFPRNLRPGRLYGRSPVEQIITTILIGLRREAAKLNWYKEGNIPDALLPVPPDWSGQDLNDYQKIFDARMRDPRKRFGKVVFVPGGGAPILTRSEAALFGPFDEWMARVCAYAFDLPPLPFVQQQNRATAETANSQALEEGLESVMIWWKALMDHIATKIFKFDDIEYVYDDMADIKPLELIESLTPAMLEGLVSGDEMRTDIGREPIGLRHFVKGIGPMGFMFVDDMVKASELGLTLYGPAGAPQQPMLGPDGLPVPGAPPAGPMLLSGPPGSGPGNGFGGASNVALAQLAPVLAGVPPELLQAVGLGDGGPSQRTVDVTSDDEAETEPMAGQFHPQVLRTLRDAESNIVRLSSKRKRT